MRVLVTGGAGYIGSHTVVELIENGYEPVVVDNLINSSLESLNRVAKITGTSVEFHQFDVCDTPRLTELLDRAPCMAAIHFAGLKAVGESVVQPIRYYRNNIDSTLSLIEAVSATSNAARPPRVIFSSSATVYGEPQILPFTENHPVGQNITNPYGQTKSMCEQILSDAAVADANFQAIALRYFNPIGAHPTGLIGEDPKQTPNNLAPYIAQVAVGRLEHVGIFGNDYNTVDGTGVRDYVHVMDIARAHISALEFHPPGFHAFNLGTGRGVSVKQLIAIFESVSKKTIRSRLLPRRPGDTSESFCSAEKAKTSLNWSTNYTIEDACEHLWIWQQNWFEPRRASNG